MTRLKLTAMIHAYNTNAEDGANHSISSISTQLQQVDADVTADVAL